VLAIAAAGHLAGCPLAQALTGPVIGEIRKS